MARFLLTGAGGFVGRALLRRLVADGHEVVALTSRPPTAGGTVEWRRFDLLESGEAEIAALVEEARVSHCLHAAWYTNHADYLVAEINRDWVAASLRLAAGFEAGGGGRFVALGTCLEYDQKADGGRFSEARTPLRPDTLYARCKAELFERLGGSAGDFAWARLFYLYGPGDRGGRLVPYILSRLAAGEPVAAKYGGLRRDYLHVDDLAEQLVRIATGPVRGAINAGSGSAERIADLFRLAGELAGRPDLVEANDATDPGQSELIEADMDLYRASLREPPARPLRQGLAELIGAPR